MFVCLSTQDITGTKLFSGVNRLPVPGEGGCGDGGGLITDGLLGGGGVGYDDADSKDDGAYATQGCNSIDIYNLGVGFKNSLETTLVLLGTTSLDTSHNSKHH